MPPRALRAWLLLASTVTLGVGLALGFTLGVARAGGDPASRATARPPATRPPTSVVVRPVVSPACPKTAARGEQLIQLLVTGQRHRAAGLLAGSIAVSRHCHHDAAR
jgi:hypothetical protein